MIEAGHPVLRLHNRIHHNSFKLLFGCALKTTPIMLLSWRHSEQWHSYSKIRIK